MWKSHTNLSILQHFRVLLRKVVTHLVVIDSLCFVTLLQFFPYNSNLHRFDPSFPNLFLPLGDGFWVREGVKVAGQSNVEFEAEGWLIRVFSGLGSRRWRSYQSEISPFSSSAEGRTSSMVWMVGGLEFNGRSSLSSHHNIVKTLPSCSSLFNSHFWP